MSDVDEIKSPFLRKNIEERGIIDDLVTDFDRRALSPST
jgi:hypothetical protein